MKKLTKLLILSLIVVVVGLSSCSKSAGEYKFVPDNATLVLVFDGKALAEKSGFSSFSESKSYALIQEELGDDEMKSFKMLEPMMKNTDESGLNMKSNFYMFMYKKESENYFAAAFDVLDKAKFEANIQKVLDSEEGTELSIEKGEGFSYIADEALIAWDDAKLLVLGKKDGTADKETFLAEAKTLWSIEEGKGIASNDDFTKFDGNRKDISLWMDYAVFYDQLPPMQKMMMQSNMPFDMAGTMLHFYADFQKGKAVLSYDVVMNEEMASFMKDHQIMKDKFDIEILEVLPAQSYANFSMALDFLSYYEIIKSTMEQQQVDFEQANEQIKAQTGMTITEALNEFSGEVVVSLHRIAIVEKEKTDYQAYYESDGSKPMSEFKKMVKEPVPYYAVAAEMNNDKLFNVLIQNMGPMLTKTGDYYSMSMGKFEAFFGLFEKKLVFTNDKELIDQLSDGKVDGKSLADTDVASNLKDFPAYGSLNFNMADYPEGLIDFMKESMEEDFAVFENIFGVFKSMEIKPKSNSEAEMILWMSDDSQNSLELILHTIDNNVKEIAEK